MSSDNPPEQPADQTPTEELGDDVPAHVRAGFRESPVSFVRRGGRLTDGQERGLTAPGAGTDPTLFVADADPSSTTDPLDADSDGGGVSDDGEDLNLDGIDVPASDLDALFEVDPDLWLQEADLTEEFYRTFDGKVPAALYAELAALRYRLKLAQRA